MRNIDYAFTNSIIATVIKDVNEARDKFKNGDFIVDFRASYQLNTVTKISLVVNNLFNTEYMSRPANMMPPRTIALQCNMKI
jgi:outer membrane receptor protein involved in Fe transport